MAFQVPGRRQPKKMAGLVEIGRTVLFIQVTSKGTGLLGLNKCKKININLLSLKPNYIFGEIRKCRCPVSILLQTPAAYLLKVSCSSKSKCQNYVWSNLSFYQEFVLIYLDLYLGFQYKLCIAAVVNIVLSSKLARDCIFKTSYGLSIIVVKFNLFYVSFLSDFREKWARPNWDQQLTPKIIRPLRMAHIRQSICPRW